VEQGMTGEGSIPKSKPKRLRRRLLWVAIGLIALILSGVGGTYWYLTRPAYLAARATEALERMTGAKVTVATAEFDLSGVLTLSNVRLVIPGVDDAAAELLSVQQIRVVLNQSALRRGRIEPVSIELEQPMVSLTELADGQYAVQHLPKRPKPKEPKRALPRILVSNGVIRCGELADGRYGELGRVRLEGVLEAKEGDPGHYHFALNQIGDERLKPMVLVGHYRTEDRRLKAELNHIALDGPHSHLMPRQIRNFWAQHHPAGSLQNIVFSHNPQIGPSFSARIDGGELTLLLPRVEVKNKTVSTTDRFPTRVTEVTGRFAFVGRAIEADFSGLIEGLRYHIVGQGAGFHPDHSPFRLELTTELFRITERPRYYDILPVGARKFFELMEPTGRLKTATVIHRDVEKGPVLHDGRVEVLDGSFTYKKFPYPISNVRAEIWHDSVKGARIERLIGTSASGGQLTATGVIGRDGDVKIKIVAKSTPIDDQLRSALIPASRHALDQVFDREAWERLRAKGHFVSAADREAERARHVALLEEIELARQREPASLERLRGEKSALEKAMKRPVFDLGGRCDIEVDVQSVPGKKIPQVVVTVDILEANGLYEGFGYPIRIRTGRLVFYPNHSVFEKVRAVGLHGGLLHLEGRVNLEEGKTLEVYPQLSLTVSDVEIDSLLLDVLGDASSAALRQIQLGGRINIDGRIHRPRGMPIQIDLGLKLRQGVVRPGGGRFAIEKLEGSARLTLQGLRIERLNGVRRFGKDQECPIALNGQFNFSTKAPSSRLHLVGKNLMLEDEWMDLISADASLRTQWAAHRPSGRFDAEVDLVLDGMKIRQHDVTLRPASLRFEYGGGTVALQATTGSIRLRPNRIQFGTFAGRLSDGGSFTLAGDVDTTMATPSNLKLSLEAESITPTLRRLMPTGVRKSVDQIGLRGRYRLGLDQIRWQREAKSIHYQTQGTLSLTQASGRLGLPISDFDGQIKLDISDQGKGQKTRLSIGADRMTVEGQPITKVKATVRQDGSTRLDWALSSGSMHGGQLRASGAIDSSSGGYHANLRLIDASLDQLALANMEEATKGKD
jgi:hypothetical protein